MQTLPTFIRTARASIQFIATATFAVISAAALASEATSFEAPASSLSRAAVKAEIGRGQASASPRQLGDATVFADTIVAPRSREAVRAEALQAAHDHRVNPLYVGA
jgi:phosphate/sulfate permease